MFSKMDEFKKVAVISVVFWGLGTATATETAIRVLEDSPQVDQINASPSFYEILDDAEERSSVKGERSNGGSSGLDRPKPDSVIKFFRHVVIQWSEFVM